MATTELTTLNRSVRTAGENAPNLGCGYTRLRPAETATGDFVAIQVEDDVAVALVDIDAGAHTTAGVLVATVNFPANSRGKIIYRPFTQVTGSTGTVLLYHRCK